MLVDTDSPEFKNLLFAAMNRGSITILKKCIKSISRFDSVSDETEKWVYVFNTTIEK